MSDHNNPYCNNIIYNNNNITPCFLRVLKSFFCNELQIIYIVLFIVFAHKHSAQFGLICIVFYLINVVCRILECRIIISKVTIIDNNIHIEYWKWKTIRNVIVSLNRVRIEIFDVHRSPLHSSIVFCNKYNIVIRQYISKYWTLETMQEVAKKIEETKKEYQSNQKDS